jgi:hypothetical protein
MKMIARATAVLLSAGLVVGVSAAPLTPRPWRTRRCSRPSSGAVNEIAGGDTDGIGAAVVTVDPATSQVSYLHSSVFSAGAIRGQLP